MFSGDIKKQHWALNGLNIPATEGSRFIFTLDSQIIGGVGIIWGLDIVIIINNRGRWTGLKK